MKKNFHIFRTQNLYQNRTTILPIMILFLLFLCLPFVTTKSYYIRLSSLIMCFSVLAASIDLLSGYLGLSAFGHAGYFGFTAYIVAYFSTQTELNHVMIILIALVGNLILSMLFAFICNKVWDNTFFIVNLALGQTIWGLAYRWANVTGGDFGISNVPRPVLFGFDFSGALPLYWLLFSIFVLTIFVLYRFVNSPFGLTIKGIAQSRTRMSALGYNIYLHKWITYVVSATAAGISGIMYVYLFRFISPSEINTLMASKAFLMALVGGAGTISGGIIGAGIIVIVENIVSDFTDRWVLILGGLYIFTVMVSPQGVIGMAREVKTAVQNRMKRDVVGE